MASKRSFKQFDWDAAYRVGAPPWDTGSPAEELVRLIDNGAVRPCEVLDIGCGTGANAVFLAKRRFDVTAVDVSPLAIERARVRCERENALVRFVCGSVFDFSKSSDKFDFILDVGFYHFIRQVDLQKYLDTLWWLTKPGTSCLVLAGAPSEPADNGPPQVSEDDLRFELGRLFEMVDLHPFRFAANSRADGFPGWSCLLRRPEMPKRTGHKTAKR